MTEPSRNSMPGREMTGYGYGRPPQVRRPESANLADILERVLDKGIVIAGDIQVNLLDIELLTIKLRLVIASVDRAKEMGIDWWEHDPTLSSGSRRTEMVEENRRLRERIAALEAREQEDAPVADRGGRRAVNRPDDLYGDEPDEYEPRERRGRRRPSEEDGRD